MSSDQPAIYECGCSRHKVNAGLCDVFAPGGIVRPPVTLTDTVWLGPGPAPCLHRYVRPEIPARMLMTPGEHTTQMLTSCVDCRQLLGVKVTVTIELVPVP